MLDRFGGWTGLTSKATGFFRVEEIGGRWWFIDPDGNAFISIGVNHVDPRELQLPCNRHVYEEKYGSDAAFYGKAEKTLRDWKFNTVGPFSGYRNYVQPGGLPYIINLATDALAISSYQPFYGRKNKELNTPDVFDEKWADGVEKIVKPLCARHKDDPLLIGYCYVDAPCWDQVTRWVDEILGAGDAPGKRAYLELVKRRYSCIGEWNFAHATDYRDFDAILEDRDPHKRNLPSWVGCVDRPRIDADDQAFLGLIARRYYEVLGKAFRRHDANHLLLGDRFDCNRGVPEPVLEQAGGHTDVLCVQYYPVDHYRNYEHHDALMRQYHARVRKPIFLVDSTFSVPSRAMPSPFGPRVADQGERAKKYAEYFNNVFGMPFVIGWGWCGYIDGSFNREPFWQHSGLRNELDEPYEELVNQIKRTNETIYTVATNNSPS